MATHINEIVGLQDTFKVIQAHRLVTDWIPHQYQGREKESQQQESKEIISCVKDQLHVLRFGKVAGFSHGQETT